MENWMMVMLLHIKICGIQGKQHVESSARVCKGG